MSTFGRSAARFDAIKTATSRKIRTFDRPKSPNGGYLPPSELFGCNTFTTDLLEKTLKKQDFDAFRQHAQTRAPIPREVADQVATAVKDWAISRGATHYCHWFQPQTGATAEKHDSFFNLDINGVAIEKFRGADLIQSEPDASSFPSGGRRSTFEARGYTAWDASSPIFLMESDNGVTLCIPSLFVSYSGEALDYKTPLLRSNRTLDEEATKSLKLMGENAEHVLATCGPEQEYFLVDKALHDMRPDLVLAGRSLMGNPPPKGQQLDDHYFGAIKTRILAIMMESEQELFKLGIPAKTRHNEVAPSQCEMAPIFEATNLAADHNQLVMEVIKKVASRHEMVALFHEKPYGGMNGSGKHINWSLLDSNGNNLLEPGEDPSTNVRFLYFLSACVKAVHDYGDLLRSAIATPGNDFRLGANEAPPAIMSVFLGETLTEVLDQISGDRDNTTDRPQQIDLDLARVPVISRDNTDRNRTSPFAFTGNKFEFRAVGSSASISNPITVINAAMASALKEMNTELEKLSNGKAASEDQILQVIQNTVKATRDIRFEGNNYSDDWHQEAEKRGLPNLRTTPDALTALKREKVETMLAEFGILSKEENEARYNVRVEHYIKTRLIEFETLLDMVNTHVLPSATSSMNQIAQTIKNSKDATGTAAASLTEMFNELVKETDSLSAARKELTAFVQKIGDDVESPEVAKTIAYEGQEIIETVQEAVANLENVVDDQLWSLPKSRELIFFQ